MLTNNLPTWTQLIAEFDLRSHPSQLHGLICGVLAGNRDDLEWEALVFDGHSPDQQELLIEMYNASAAQLDDLNFEFTLLVPEDEESLQTRAEALTVWCQGFLAGLKFAQVPIENRKNKNDQVAECLEDLIEIAKMKYENVVENEEDEVAYTDLVEYVRMAAVLIYETLREPAGKVVNH